MSTLVWDDTGNRRFETGVSKGVLFPLNQSTGVYDTGVPWNGLTQVAEKPDGATPNPQYADNIKYLDLLSAEIFGGTIEAYTYPDEFGPCDGTFSPSPGVVVGQQSRQKFGLCYRTEVGNDVNSDLGYKLHIVYGCQASPSEKDFSTINDSPDAVTFSWDFTTTAVPVTGQKPTSLLVIDSTQVNADDLSALEQLLYGTAGVDAALPDPDTILALFAGTVQTVTTIEPTFTPATHTVTIPVVTGVTYHMDGGVVTGDVVIAVDKVITATADSGFVFSAVSVDAWHIVYS